MNDLDTSSTMSSYAVWAILTMVALCAFTYVWCVYLYPALVRVYWCCAKALYWCMRNSVDSVRPNKRSRYNGY